MEAHLQIFINERGPYRGTLTVETEAIDITSATTTYKDDPQWTFVDKAGHFHAVTGAGKFPTLEAYTKTLPCPGGCDDPDCEGVTEARYRCRICRKRVKPGRVVDQAGGWKRTMPGRTSWGVSVETVEPPPAGTVSVRCASTGLAGRDWFGLAEGRVDSIVSGSGGQTYTYEAHGITELGRRP